jgi:hypothetical protein
MNPQNIEELVRKVDRRARKNNHDIARLQELRAELQDDRERRAYTTIDGESSSIFDDRDISDDYAYHRGGRDEPQFNLALRKYDGEQKVRYGVAFHYKRGEHMDDLSTLRTRIALFNKYLRANPEQFSGLNMWDEPKDSRKPREDYPPQEIPESLLERGTFFFLGRRRKPSEIDYEDILNLFDRLLPLYKYIERNLDTEELPDENNSADSSGVIIPDVEEDLTHVADEGIKSLAYVVDTKAREEGYKVADFEGIRLTLQDWRNGKAHPKMKWEGRAEEDMALFHDVPDDGSESSVKGNFAFQYGGRNELQFNLKIREYDEERKIRYGVAIRLQSGRNRDIEKPVRRRVKLFNHYLEEHREEFSGLGMCYSRKIETDDGEKKIPSRLFPPHKISGRLLGKKITVVLGRREKPSDLTYDAILTLWDELLPLYKYIERNLEPKDSFDSDSFSPPSDEEDPNVERKYKTTLQRSKTEVEKDLEHGRMKDILTEQLSSKSGVESVQREYSLEDDRRIDLVVERENGRWFYEIKPYDTPRECLREAMGQLLEYAYWSGSEVPECLVVVGKSELEEEGKAYLSTLKEQFSLPLEYQSVQVG